MKELIKNPMMSLILKIFLPALLLFWLYKRLKKATDKQLKTANVLVNVICIFYALVIINNLIWLAAFLAGME